MSSSDARFSGREPDYIIKSGGGDFVKLPEGMTVAEANRVLEDFFAGIKVDGVGG